MKGELIVGERPFREGLILDLKGDLTKLAESSLLHGGQWARIPEGKFVLVLNFTEVEYINSAGIAVLIRLSQTAITSGLTLYGYGVNSHYQKMFRLIGLTEFIMIYPDEYALMLRFQ